MSKTEVPAGGLDSRDVRSAVESLLPWAKDLLQSLIAFPSTPGQEHDAMVHMEKVLSELRGEVERVPFPADFTRDPEYSSPIPSISYDGRFNLRFRREGRRPGRTLLFNAHMDVVPPSEGMLNPWVGEERGGTIYGRGACDDKGPLVSVVLALKALESLGIDLPGSIVFHCVNEEENGGNGTLGMIRHGEKADGCIVMEPSAGSLYTSVRGAVWFRIRFFGKAGHSGQAGQTKSALTLARRAMDALEGYHADLLAASRDLPLFDRIANPMPLTFGHLAAGNWPAAAPNEALLQGVLGFLPNKSREEVCREFEGVLRERAGLASGEFELGFTYRHDCSVVDPKEPLPVSIMESAAEARVPLDVAAFPASCDSWFYPHFLSIPTVVYGPGDLKYAHSKEERIDLEEIAASAQVLIHAAARFCGANP